MQTTTQYQAYNDTHQVNFKFEVQAIEYASLNNMQTRTVQVTIPDEEIKKDWQALENALYDSALFGKVVYGVTTPNESSNPFVLNAVTFGFYMFTKVLTDGKNTGASDTALQMAFSILLPSLDACGLGLTQPEKDFVNSLLEQYGFLTRI